VVKSVTALFAALIAGFLLIGSPTNASAHTIYVYRTVHVVKNVWRVHNIWRTRYVHRIRRVVHVTRIRPIIRVHVVTRIHYRTVAIVRHVNVWVTHRLRPRYIVVHSVVRIWHHHRWWHHHHHW
jgi:hypothetical protein